MIYTRWRMLGRLSSGHRTLSYRGSSSPERTNLRESLPAIFSCFASCSINRPSWIDWFGSVDGDITVYELRMAWKRLISRSEHVFRLNVNSNGRDGRRSGRSSRWYRLGPGRGRRWNSLGRRGGCRCSLDNW